ncbi:MAG: hypothetical protein MR033_00645 [Clostridiales bacterium]|nr:hypothetical protein [Clostridiales bacterium]
MRRTGRSARRPACANVSSRRTHAFVTARPASSSQTDAPAAAPASMNRRSSPRPGSSPNRNSAAPVSSQNAASDAAVTAPRRAHSRSARSRLYTTPSPAPSAADSSSCTPC